MEKKYYIIKKSFALNKSYLLTRGKFTYSKAKARGDCSSRETRGWRR